MPVPGKKRIRDRGVPPPPAFDLWKLPDGAELRPQDVAAWKRQALSYVERLRREGTDGLEWKIVGHRPRTTVGSLKKAMRAVTVEGRIAPNSRTAPKAVTKTKAPKGGAKTKSPASVEAGVT